MIDVEKKGVGVKVEPLLQSKALLSKKLSYEARHKVHKL